MTFPAGAGRGRLSRASPWSCTSTAPSLIAVRQRHRPAHLRHRTPRHARRDEGDRRQLSYQEPDHPPCTGSIPAKVEVVYNAIEYAVMRDIGVRRREVSASSTDEKIVLFLGRITHAEGPGIFPRRRQAGAGGDGQRQVRDGRQRGHDPPDHRDGCRHGHRRTRCFSPASSAGPTWKTSSRWPTCT